VISVESVALPSVLSRFVHERRDSMSGSFTARVTSGRSARRSKTMMSAGKRLMPRHFE
jgi:hypothetical protein